MKTGKMDSLALSNLAIKCVKQNISIDQAKRNYFKDNYENYIKFLTFYKQYKIVQNDYTNLKNAIAYGMETYIRRYLESFSNDIINISVGISFKQSAVTVMYTVNTSNIQQKLFYEINDKVSQLTMDFSEDIKQFNLAVEALNEYGKWILLELL